MKRTKQTVLFPFGENGLLLHPLANIDQCMKSYKKEVGYFFTAEELNEYTQNVIKQSLETAADKAQLYRQNSAYKHSKFNLKIEKCLNYNVGIDLETITNTFEETFKKFEV